MAPIKLTAKELEWDPQRTKEAIERLRGKPSGQPVVPRARVEAKRPEPKPSAAPPVSRTTKPPESKPRARGKYSATEQLIRQLLAIYPNRLVTFEKVEIDACTYFNVSIAAVRRDQADPRHIFVRRLRYFLAHHLIPGITHAEIAKLVNIKSPDKVSGRIEQMRGLLDTGRVRQRNVIDLARHILETSPTAAPD